MFFSRRKVRTIHQYLLRWYLSFKRVDMLIGSDHSFHSKHICLCRFCNVFLWNIILSIPPAWARVPGCRWIKKFISSSGVLIGLVVFSMVRSLSQFTIQVARLIISSSSRGASRVTNWSLTWSFRVLVDECTFQCCFSPSGLLYYNPEVDGEL